MEANLGLSRRATQQLRHGLLQLGQRHVAGAAPTMVATAQDSACLGGHGRVAGHPLLLLRVLPCHTRSNGRGGPGG